MIPTVIVAAFVARLFLPQRWPWLVGIIVASGVVWAVIISFGDDITWPIRFAAFGLGVINAIVGSALAAPVRYFASRRSRDNAS